MNGKHDVGGRPEAEPGRSGALLLVPLLAVALAGCGGGARGVAGDADVELRKQARARAGKAAARLMDALMGELSAALAAGPPEKAVSVCAEVARRISRETAEKEGLYLRRTALRLRNPENAPDPFERAVLERWAGEDNPDVHAEVVETARGGAELRWMKPVLLKPLCTTCHGPEGTMTDAVRAAISRHYPGDRATGFVPGDLRGAVSVRVPLEKD